MKQFYAFNYLISLFKRIYSLKVVGLSSLDNLTFLNTIKTPEKISLQRGDLKVFTLVKNLEFQEVYQLLVKADIFSPDNPIQQTNYLSGVFRRILEINLIRSTHIKNNKCYVSI